MGIHEMMTCGKERLRFGEMSRERTVAGAWIKVFLLCGIFWRSDGATLLEVVQMKGILQEVYEQLSNASLTYLLEDTNITVFLPSNNALLDFKPELYGFPSRLDHASFRQLMSYHVVNGKITTIRMHTHDTAISKSGTKVYFNAYQENSNKMHYVNGATVIDADIPADNGVLHVVDKVISPVGSTKTLRQYYKLPDLTSLSFQFIRKASSTLHQLEAQSDNPEVRFTVFSPNDFSVAAAPSRGREDLLGNFTLLQNVFKAHVILGKVYFLPHNRKLPPLLPLLGTLEFSRLHDRVFVSNNMVQTEVLLPNIPIANGVIHVVDNILYYVYQNLLQKLQAMSQTRVVARLFGKLPSSLRKSLENEDRKFTLFAPTDDAIAKLPRLQQRLLQENITVMTEILTDHIVPNLEASTNAFPNDGTLQTLGNSSLTLYQMESDLYVEGGSVRAKLVHVDVGCTNGVIHLITNVMFYKNFSLWDAIQDTNNLSQAASYVHRYPEIQNILTTDSTGPMTVFLPGDNILEVVPSRIKDKFATDLSYMNQALKGQIVQKLEISSSQVKSSLNVGTLLGKHVLIWKSNDGDLYVKGGHISAKVVVSDIWCSNGILHIIDKLLHVSTKSIIEELEDDDSLSLAYSAVKAAHMKTFLSMESEKFTVFIPGNDAFWKIPKAKMSALMQSYRIKQVMRAHIANGTVRFKDSFRYGEVLRATSDQIYIIKQSDNFYVISNNIKARVVRPDIPATNGVIHVIDEVLAFPYRTVAEMMSSQSALRPFYGILSLDRQFLTQAKDEDQQLSVFAPSSGFLNTIGSERLQRVTNSPATVRKLFAGHVVQGIRVDGKYLRSRLTHKCVITNEFSVMFTIFRNRSRGIYIDAGYGTQRLYLINPAFGCSNGIVYIIDGFLNYSPFNLLEVIEKEPLTSLVSTHFEKLLLDTSHDFLNESRLFTLFVPGNVALEFMTVEEIASVLKTNPDEKYQLFLRHVINGSAVPYRDLTTHRLGRGMRAQGVTVKRSGRDLYLHWSGIRAKITRPNIPASNGIIHVVQRLLYITERDALMLARSTTPTASTARRLVRKPNRTTPTPVTSRRDANKSTRGPLYDSPRGTTASLMALTKPSVSGACLCAPHLLLAAFAWLTSLLLTTDLLATNMKTSEHDLRKSPAYHSPSC